MNVALNKLADKIGAIDARIGKHDGALAGCYRELVLLLDGSADRDAFVDEHGKLRPGTRDAVCKLAPHVQPTTFSSAWSAFKADPDAFSAADTVSMFQRIVSAAKGRGTDTPNPRKKALKALARDVARALGAGLDRGAIVAQVSAAIALYEADAVSEAVKTENASDKPRKAAPAADSAADTESADEPEAALADAA